MLSRHLARSFATLPGLQSLRYFLILDFEATCGNSGFPVHESEIIEFPTLLYNVKERAVEATFAEYVRPLLHPNLTEFCTELTGITQETVDKADTFPQVWRRYNEFLIEHNAFDNANSFAFLTCGAWDLKTMLPTQLKHSASLALASSPISATPPPLFDRIINIKKAFSKHYDRKKDVGMAGMLKRLNMQLEGRHHSGIDDCKNIARIVRRMQEDDWKAKF